MTPHLLAQKESPLQVDVQGRFPRLETQVCSGFDESNPGAIDEDVDPPVISHNFIDDAGYRSLADDVTEVAAARPLTGRRHLHRFFRLNVEYPHPGTHGGKGKGYLAPDARGPSAHHCDFVLEAESGTCKVERLPAF